ncbi:MAG: DUF3189 family protein [Bacillota bacterium]
MKVIYHCYGGAHSSVAAAGLHLGIIASEPQPTVAELESLPYFDKNDPKDIGRVRLMGVDDLGAEVLVLGRSAAAPIVIRTLAGLAQMYGAEDAIFGDTTGCINWRMVAGGIGSRRIRVQRIGRPLVTSGTRQALTALARLVSDIRALQRQAHRDVKGDGGQRGGDGVRAPGAILYIPAGQRPVAESALAGGRLRKVIYHCHGSTHSSVLAAALHLGVVDARRRPSVDEIINLKLFDRVENDAIGTPFLCGHDEGGREVYVLGTGGHKALVTCLVNSFVATCYRDEPPPYLVDTLTLVNTRTRVGGFASRRLGQAWGRRAAAQGLRDNFENLVDLVHLVKVALGGPVSPEAARPVRPSPRPVLAGRE